MRHPALRTSSEGRSGQRLASTIPKQGAVSVAADRLEFSYWRLRCAESRYRAILEISKSPLRARFQSSATRLKKLPAISWKAESSPLRY
jgi:hypothetical protein